MSAEQQLVDRRSLLAGALALALTTATGCQTRSERVQLVEILVEGDSFRPAVELKPGSSVSVSWTDLDSGKVIGKGTRPVLDTSSTQRVGLTAKAEDRSALDQITTLNFGFDHRDDAGRFNIGPTYDHPPQPVVGIANLQALTQLRRFCAAGTRMAGNLDLSGLTELEHVECFHASIQSVYLAGCSRLVRLCLERCRVSRLDLNPVRENLKDLRVAVQQTQGAGLVFAPLASPLSALYHYCVRDQPVHDMIPHSQLPVIEEYWVWGSQQRRCDAPISPHLRSFRANANAYDQSSVDAVLASQWARRDGRPGAVSMAGESAIGRSEPPSSSGRAMAEDLRARGWRITTN